MVMGNDIVDLVDKDELIRAIDDSPDLDLKEQSVLNAVAVIKRIIRDIE